MAWLLTTATALAVAALFAAAVRFKQRNLGIEAVPPTDAQLVGGGIFVVLFLLGALNISMS